MCRIVAGLAIIIMGFFVFVKPTYGGPVRYLFVIAKCHNGAKKVRRVELEIWSMPCAGCLSISGLQGFWFKV